jgi:hypothetical protein
MKPENLRSETESSRLGSIGRIMRDIVGNVQEIIRSEVRLAKTEIKEEVSGAAKAGGFYGGAAVCGFYGLGFILLAGVYALSTVVAPWLAALIVGFGIAVVGGIFYAIARRRTHELSRKTELTFQTAKDNVRWFKDRFK